jgi:fatty acid desaturase
MTDHQDETHDEHPHATTNQPYNADKPRPMWTPLLAVIGLMLVIAVVFAAITWLRYNT